MVAKEKVEVSQCPIGTFLSLNHISMNVSPPDRVISLVSPMLEIIQRVSECNRTITSRV